MKVPRPSTGKDLDGSDATFACPDLATFVCPDLATFACPDLATFACPDLASFACVDDLGPVMTRQMLEPDRAVLASRGASLWGSRGRCGTRGRRLAHEPFGWRPTILWGQWISDGALCAPMCGVRTPLRLRRRGRRSPGLAAGGRFRPWCSAPDIGAGLLVARGGVGRSQGRDPGRRQAVLYGR